MLDSRPLRCFVAVARELHFGRAADQLEIAQSALSRQLLELERKLGVRLLNRGRRSSISLTHAGAALLPEAELALRQLDRAEFVTKRTARGEMGSIDVGYVLSAALSGLLPQVLTAFRSAHPSVEVRLTSMETPRQIEALRSGALDVGFIRPRANYPDSVEASIVHREPLVVAVGNEHPLATQDVDVRALARESFIAPQFDEASGFVEYLAALGARGGFEPRLAHRVRDFITAAMLASAGYGVVLAPKSIAAIQSGNLVCKPIRGYDTMAELAVAYRTAAASPAARLFVNLAKATATAVGSVKRPRRSTARTRKRA
ncbi:MAG TPA: LysR substrate-binding domain-containing protein [Steroidobacter sp.]|uniref:LysR substrate-binding domain-containing protein n=1 Tax=Steroidobacter sp. TaxID=1978227 RepID=UPI002ED8DCEA